MENGRGCVYVMCIKTRTLSTAQRNARVDCVDRDWVWATFGLYIKILRRYCVEQVNRNTEKKNNVNWGVNETTQEKVVFSL